jgi:GxxExxY protein
MPVRQRFIDFQHGESAESAVLAEKALCFLRNHPARQVTIPVLYKGAEVGDGFKADIVVAGELILEIKAVSTFLPIHEVQLRTYVRMSGIYVGLLLNFNVPRLVDGLRRYVV